jgi:LysM repeat protein
VAPGDSLFGIALAYGDSLYNLARRNGIVNPDLIFVGQRIEVCGRGGGPGPGPVVGPGPKPRPGGKCSYTHIVKPGENLFRIALNYGTNYGTVAAVNNLVSANLIYVGQRLCIP